MLADLSRRLQFAVQKKLSVDRTPLVRDQPNQVWVLVKLDGGKDYENPNSEYRREKYVTVEAAITVQSYLHESSYSHEIVCR